MSDASSQHRADAASLCVRCAIVTLSDTRTHADDRSGALIGRLLREAGHQVVDYRIIPDEPDVLKGLLDELLARQDVDVVLSTGGTGVSPRDQTVPVIESILTTPLPGFGELFRMLSYRDIGSAAMLSRALGGIARGKVLLAMPGSTGAVELAMTRIILPELRHLVGLVKNTARLGERLP